MASINRFSFKSTCSQKVIVEELIDGELKGIVGGETLSFSSSDIPADGTVIIELSTEDKQTGNERTVKRKTKKTVGETTEITEQVLKYVNGVQVP
ncbi:hypothetical protein A6770_11325 [Nostoc minutum NIES-26]|uniref:Uncharacterized protein n=1 Tax=Nostoc minutum NIES-26 TaxID=1844469 RepID=A0A367RUX3_9NOSO|nr:hypothetical protein A6770_11325 [Nostoc minutum NIES-26]